MADTFDVALGEAGGDAHNTIVLSGVDLVLPLEMDLDADPFQDDEVQLRSEDGSYERVLSVTDDDVDVDADQRLAFYRFRDVPPGAYRASVRVGGAWSVVTRGILVTREGAFLGRTALAAERPQVALAPPAASPAPSPPPADAPEPPPYVDQEYDDPAVAAPEE